MVRESFWIFFAHKLFLNSFPSPPIFTIFHPKISTVELWTNSFATQIPIGRGVEGETPAFWTRPQRVWSTMSTLEVGGCRDGLTKKITWLYSKSTCIIFSFCINNSSSHYPKPYFWLWAAKHVGLGTSNKGSRGQTQMGTCQRGWWPMYVSVCFDLVDWLDFAFAMSIYIPNHSKLINPFILREEVLICWSFAAVASNVVSSNLKPLFPKVRPHPWRWRTPRGQTAGCLRDALWTVAIKCHQKPQKLHGKKNLQLEKRPSISPRIQWKSTVIH